MQGSKNTSPSLKYAASAQPNSHEPIDRPWKKVAVDIYTVDDKDYLITVDYVSNFWEIDRLRDPQSIHVCPKAEETLCKKRHS